MDAEGFVKSKIKWLGHASFRIDGDKSVIYIDPWKLKKAVPADVICITHSHYDHLSEEDVEKIRKPTTVIIGPADCKAGFGNAFKQIAPGQSHTVGDVTVEAVPAYNTDKAFHPKGNKWMGYIVTVDGFRIYHCGDTDVIPEMENVKPDVALLPVGGTYTMTVPQAADAASKISPKVAVPMHCGDIVGTLDDRESFRKSAKVPVVILDPSA
jgi:L-ascorbate metabolism protein UlaG (beta-lactamase superfamily)